MITAYISSNQKDLDEQVPYVMMAYQRADHETTHMSPNKLMFGREVSTPLDLMYELPELIKYVLNNQWVWELRDRIESANNFVRQNTQQAMHRQKHICDTQISYDQFKV